MLCFAASFLIVLYDRCKWWKKQTIKIFAWYKQREYICRFLVSLFPFLLQCLSCKARWVALQWRLCENPSWWTITNQHQCFLRLTKNKSKRKNYTFFPITTERVRMDAFSKCCPNRTHRCKVFGGRINGSEQKNSQLSKQLNCEGTDVFQDIRTSVTVSNTY